MTVRSHDAGGALVSHGYRAWLPRVGLNHPNAKCGQLAEEFRLDGGPRAAPLPLVQTDTLLRIEAVIMDQAGGSERRKERSK